MPNLSVGDAIVLASVVVPALVPLAVALYNRFLSSLPGKKADEVRAVVSEVVQAMEQIFAGMPGSGATKKAMAEQRAIAILASMHITVNPVLLDTLIEAAVSGVYAVATAPPVSAPRPPAV